MKVLILAQAQWVLLLICELTRLIWQQKPIEEIRDYIVQRYGEENCPKTPRIYKTKSKNAQEAHEAIRPTSVKRTPEMVEQALTADQFKLYNLIWKRTVACQMDEALIDTVAVDYELRGRKYLSC